jgi:hypothetical protein
MSTRAGADTPIVAGVLALGPNGSGMLRELGAAATGIDPVVNPDDGTAGAGGGLGVTAETRAAFVSVAAPSAGNAVVAGAGAGACSEGGGGAAGGGAA